MIGFVILLTKLFDIPKIISIFARFLTEGALLFAAKASTENNV